MEGNMDWSVPSDYQAMRDMYAASPARPPHLRSVDVARIPWDPSLYQLGHYRSRNPYAYQGTGHRYYKPRLPRSIDHGSGSATAVSQHGQRFLDGVPVDTHYRSAIFQNEWRPQGIAVKSYPGDIMTVTPRMPMPFTVEPESSLLDLTTPDATVSQQRSSDKISAAVHDNSIIQVESDTQILDMHSSTNGHGPHTHPYTSITLSKNGVTKNFIIPVHAVGDMNGISNSPPSRDGQRHVSTIQVDATLRNVSQDLPSKVSKLEVNNSVSNPIIVSPDEETAHKTASMEGLNRFKSLNPTATGSVIMIPNEDKNTQPESAPTMDVSSIVEKVSAASALKPAASTPSKRNIPLDFQIERSTAEKERKKKTKDSELDMEQMRCNIRRRFYPRSKNIQGKEDNGKCDSPKSNNQSPVLSNESQSGPTVPLQGPLGTLQGVIPMIPAEITPSPAVGITHDARPSVSSMTGSPSSSPPISLSQVPRHQPTAQVSKGLVSNNQQTVFFPQANGMLPGANTAVYSVMVNNTQPPITNLASANLNITGRGVMPNTIIGLSSVVVPQPTFSPTNVYTMTNSPLAFVQPANQATENYSMGNNPAFASLQYRWDQKQAVPAQLMLHANGLTSPTHVTVNAPQVPQSTVVSTKVNSTVTCQSSSVVRTSTGQSSVCISTSKPGTLRNIVDGQSTGASKQTHITANDSTSRIQSSIDQSLIQKEASIQPRADSHSTSGQCMNVSPYQTRTALTTSSPKKRSQIMCINAEKMCAPKTCKIATGNYVLNNRIRTGEAKDGHKSYPVTSVSTPGADTHVIIGHMPGLLHTVTGDIVVSEQNLSDATRRNVQPEGSVMVKDDSAEYSKDPTLPPVKETDVCGSAQQMVLAHTSPALSSTQSPGAPDIRIESVFSLSEDASFGTPNKVAKGCVSGDEISVNGYKAQDKKADRSFNLNINNDVSFGQCEENIPDLFDCQQRCTHDTDPSNKADDKEANVASCEGNVQRLDSLDLNCSVNSPMMCGNAFKALSVGNYTDSKYNKSPLHMKKCEIVLKRLPLPLGKTKMSIRWKRLKKIVKRMVRTHHLPIEKRQAANSSDQTCQAPFDNSTGLYEAKCDKSNVDNTAKDNLLDKEVNGGIPATLVTIPDKFLMATQQTNMPASDTNVCACATPDDSNTDVPRPATENGFPNSHTLPSLQQPVLPYEANKYLLVKSQAGSYLLPVKVEGLANMEEPQLLKANPALASLLKQLQCGPQSVNGVTNDTGDPPTHTLVADQNSQGQLSETPMDVLTQPTHAVSLEPASHDVPIPEENIIPVNGSTLQHSIGVHDASARPYEHTFGALDEIENHEANMRNTPISKFNAEGICAAHPTAMDNGSPALSEDPLTEGCSPQSTSHNNESMPHQDPCTGPITVTLRANGDSRSVHSPDIEKPPSSQPCAHRGGMSRQKMAHLLRIEQLKNKIKLRQYELELMRIRRENPHLRIPGMFTYSPHH